MCPCNRPSPATILNPFVFLFEDFGICAKEKKGVAASVEIEAMNLIRFIFLVL